MNYIYDYMERSRKMLYRGDVVWVSDSKGTGSEQRGERPALIVSNDTANEHAPIVTVVWLTTQEKKPLPTHCEVKGTEKSTALCENITTVSKERIGDFIRSATDAEMQEVDRCIMVALGLYKESAESQGKELVADIIAGIDDAFYKEKDNRIAEGIDIAGSGIKGKPIVAAADGIVSIATYNTGGYGYYVMVNHGTGSDGKKYVTLYAHMTKYIVKVGQSVRKGQTIGYVGTSGASTGYHLHFEIRANGSAVNPLKYLQ
jgi:mRNA-degrading endonuclease toxin of MazEF toxin-antitoxin module